MRELRHLTLCIHSPHLPAPRDPFSLSLIHVIALAEIFVPKFRSNGEGAPPCGGQGIWHVSNFSRLKKKKKKETNKKIPSLNKIRVVFRTANRQTWFGFAYTGQKGSRPTCLGASPRPATQLCSVLHETSKLSFFLSVCVVQACENADVLIYVCTCSGQSKRSGVYLCSFPTIALRQDLSYNWKLPI